MRSRFVSSLCAAFLVWLVQTPVAHGAVVFNFAAMAVGNEGPFTTATVGGITVVASALPTPNAKPYLDDAFGRKLAGLGVCKNFNGPACNPSSDDNVTAGETLTLAFFNAANNPLSVILDPTFFRNARHKIGYRRGALIGIDRHDGNGFVDYRLRHNLGVALTGSVFDFKYKNAQFYVQSVSVSPVPLPAALPLFLSALAGLGLLSGWRWRRRVSLAVQA